MQSASDDLPRSNEARITPARAGFRLAHLMLFIAATALGIVGSRECDTQMRGRGVVREFGTWCEILSPLSLSFALALTIARLLPPRPPLAECFRQPGNFANLLTCLIMGFHAVTMSFTNFGYIKSIDNFIYYFFEFNAYGLLVYDANRGILVSWLTLAITGNWRPEPDWMDRSGRVLGAIAILVFLSRYLRWMIWW